MRILWFRASLLLASLGLGACSGLFPSGRFLSDGGSDTEDTDPPTISGLVLTTTGSLAFTPTIDLTSVSDTGAGVDRLEARVLDQVGAVIVDWTAFSEGSTMGGLSLSKFQIYTLEVRAVDQSENTSNVLSLSWKPQSNDCMGERLTDTPFANSSSNPDGLTSGTAFEICTPEQFNNIGANSSLWNKYFELDAHLDMDDLGVNYNVIGSSGTPFTGTLEGGGFTIKDLSINSPASDSVGLIGVAVTSFAVRNLTLMDLQIAGRDDTGGLIGAVDWNAASTWEIENVSASGSVSGRDRVGGLIGSYYYGTMDNISSSVTVTGNSSVGGLAGRNGQGGTITNAASDGVVTGVGEVGGLLGDCYALSITNSSSGAEVNCTGDNCGGVAGSNLGGASTLSRLSSHGPVTSTGDYVGGLFGYAERAITDSYSTSQVTGNLYVGGAVGMTDHSLQRIYAAGDVVGAAEVGGLLGAFYGSSASINDSFSTGNVSVTSASVYGSRLVGRKYSGATTILGSYYDSSSTCTIFGLGDCNTAGQVFGAGVNVSVQTDYFQLSTNAPLSSWDFTNIWQAIGGDMPILP